VLLREPDPEVEVERFGDLLAEERAQRAAADTPHDFSDEVPEGQGAVAVARARMPQRLLCGQRVDHEIPVTQSSIGNRLAQRGHTRLVVEQLANGNRFLSVLAELRPVRRDRRVDVELAARGKDVRAQCDATLRARPDDADGVLGPGSFRSGVGDATPEIDDGLSVDGDADRRADLAPLGEVAL